MKIIWTSLTCLVATGITALAPSTATLAQDNPAKLSTLKTGTYFAQGSMYGRSYRVIARAGDRLCIKIVNGPPKPYEGHQSIIISTVIQQDDEILVTSTGDLMKIDAPDKFTLSRKYSGEWELSSSFKGDLSSGLSRCLNATGNYSNQFRGSFVTGMIDPAIPAQLIAQQSDARINVREEPGADAKLAHYGIPGDRVKINYSQRDQTGQFWYKIKFDRSGAEGWVREDFIRRLN